MVERSGVGTPPGWYPDSEQGGVRYWDGNRWTDLREGLTIGDIAIRNGDVITPNGSGPLRGSQWIVRDLSRTDSRIPPYAVVLTIVFVWFFLLGLLFLLIRQHQPTGYVEVQVHSGSLFHMVQIPVMGWHDVGRVRAQVAQAQVLAAAAGD